MAMAQVKVLLKVHDILISRDIKKTKIYLNSNLHGKIKSAQSRIQKNRGDHQMFLLVRNKD